MITIKKILAPIELSNVSAPAIRYAGSLAKHHHASVGRQSNAKNMKPMQKIKKQ